MCCMMHDVPGFFVVVRSCFFESRGDQKYPILVVTGLLSDISKLTPGSSHMYTLSCKASYDKLIYVASYLLDTSKSMNALFIWLIIYEIYITKLLEQMHQTNCLLEESVFQYCPEPDCLLGEKPAAQSSNSCIALHFGYSKSFS